MLSNNKIFNQKQHLCEAQLWYFLYLYGSTDNKYTIKNLPLTSYEEKEYTVKAVYFFQGLYSSTSSRPEY